MRALRLSLISLVFTFALIGGARDAAAQYKSGQFGFEGGYMFLGEKTGLDSHGFLLGLRGAYKGSDNWWFTARAAVSFRGEQNSLRNNTVVMLHIVPVEARYYFATDSVRPFLGVTNSFQFLANSNLPSEVFWGPGLSGGAEFRLKRDLFLGFQADAFWMLVFEGPDAPLITATTQLIFFL